VATDNDSPAPAAPTELGTVAELAAAGRITRIRGRATLAAEQYQELAHRRPLLGLPLVIYERYVSRQGVLLASAVAFRLYLWLLPLALVTAGILAGLSGSHADWVRSVTREAGVTGVARNQVVNTLQEGHQSWWWAVLFGLALLVWATRALIRTVRIVNAHVWGVTAPRQPTKKRLTDACIFLGGWLLISLLAALVTHIDRASDGGVLLALVIQAVGITAIWWGVSMTLPDARRTWTDLLPGSVLFAVSVSAMHAFSRIYLPRKIQHSSNLYGSLGIAGVILAWLFIIGEVVVGACLLNSVWSDYRQHRASRQAQA
jgi:membrane protein